MNRIYEIWTMFISYIVSELEKKREQNVLDKEHMKKLQQRSYLEQLYRCFYANYMDVAGGLKKCLESAPWLYSVVSPTYAADVIVPNPLERITGNLYPDRSYSNISFHFEVKREPTNLTLHAITTGTGAYVPVKDVQKQLQTELQKYIGDYCYSGISVYELEDRKIRIVVHDVDHPPTCQY